MTGYFTWRTIPPKRQLTVWMTKTRLLKHGSPGLAGRLTIQHASLGVLQDPTLVEVWVRNTGRAGVSASMYDRGEPLKLKMGTQILELLENGNLLKTHAAPPVARVDDVLTVGPGLISRKDQLRYVFLVDGDPELTVESPLVDVEVREDRSARADNLYRLDRTVAVTMVVSAVALGLSFVVEAIASEAQRESVQLGLGIGLSLIAAVGLTRWTGPRSG